MRRLAVALLLAFAVSPAWAAPAFVQSASSFDNAAPFTVSLTGVTTGNLIAVAAYCHDATSTISIADGTNTYTMVPGAGVTGPTDKAEGGYAKNVTGGNLTITVTCSDGPSAAWIIAHEISGVDTTAPLDGTGSGNYQNAPGTGTDAITSGTYTTSVNGDYIFGAVIDRAGPDPSIAGTGFTRREHSTDNSGPTSEDEIQSSAGSGTAATFTASGAATENYTLSMAFKPAAAPAAAVRHRAIIQ